MSTVTEFFQLTSVLSSAVVVVIACLIIMLPLLEDHAHAWLKKTLSSPIAIIMAVIAILLIAVGEIWDHYSN